MDVKTSFQFILACIQFVFVLKILEYVGKICLLALHSYKNYIYVCRVCMVSICVTYVIFQINTII